VLCGISKSEKIDFYFKKKRQGAHAAVTSPYKQQQHQQQKIQMLRVRLPRER
jgi:hypothetical protein